MIPHHGAPKCGQGAGSVDGGTKATFAFDAEIGGFFKMAEPLAARIMQRHYETNLATLKDLLEAQA